VNAVKMKAILFIPLFFVLLYVGCETAPPQRGEPYYNPLLDPSSTKSAVELCEEGARYNRENRYLQAIVHAKSADTKFFWYSVTTNTLHN